MPYVPQVRWIICSFSSIQPRTNSVHPLFQHQNTRSLHFIPIWRWISFPLHSFFSLHLSRLSAMLRIACFFQHHFHSYYVLADVFKYEKELYCNRQKERAKTMKLLENLLCESEWVCAFSIKFNKHTKRNETDRATTKNARATTHQNHQKKWAKKREKKSKTI